MRFYLIGAGFINRTHVDAILRFGFGNTAEIKVADPNSVVLNEFLQLYPGVTGYSEAERLLGEPAEKDDVVIIGTPPFTHFPLSIMALRSGRHVLCEKPLVMSQAEADLLLQESRHQNRNIGCCSSRFLGLPKIDEVKRLIHEERLGEIYKITYVHRGQRGRPGIEYQPHSRWFIDRSRSGGGALFDWGPYDFALLNDILQPERIEVAAAWKHSAITEVDPTDCVNDVESHCGAMLKYGLANGKMVWVQYERSNNTHGEAYSHTEAEGTHGAIRWQTYTTGDQAAVSFDRSGKLESVTESFPVPEGFNVMDNPVRYFVEKINGSGDIAIVNEQAIFNLKCLLAIYACTETGVPQLVTREKSQ